MKKLLTPLIFAFALILVLTQVTAAFPGMTYGGNARVTNISASVQLLPTLLGTDADVTVGTTESNATGSVAELMKTFGESAAAEIDGTVLGNPVNQPIVSVDSFQSYLFPSPTNPDEAEINVIDVDDRPLLALGAVNVSSTATLFDSTLAPNIANPTQSVSQNGNEVTDIAVALPTLTILQAEAAMAATNVTTSDANAATAQGYDAISCESESLVTGLNILELVSADAIATTVSANVNGQAGAVAGTISITNLQIGEIMSDTVVIDLGTTPPIHFNLLDGDVVVTLAPVLQGSADAKLATAEAVALRVALLADVLGLQAGTTIDIGATDVTCAAVRGNWNPADDTDGDGIVDLVDLDDDNDGLPDVFEGDATLDTDGDGIPDSRDLDSDNDGSNDIWEAGHADLDLDGDGQIDGATGKNGLSDLVENGSESGVLNYTPLDTDGDGIPDVRDLDSDNDSILDVVENGFAAQDTDGDGMLEGADDDFDGIIDPSDEFAAYGDANDQKPADTDGDGIPNSRDLDSDNDGTPDLHENGQAALDSNNDGMADGSDDDNDGIVAGIDAQPLQYGTEDGATGADTDQDGIPNAYDLDSDNDGLTDVSEAGLGHLDPDGNGMLSGSDDDNDGIVSSVDRLPDSYGTPASETPLPDADGDNIPDMQELDSDNDGIYDIDENGSGVDNNGDGMADGADEDGDGIPESADNSPTQYGLSDNNSPTAITLANGRTQLSDSMTLLLFALITLAGLTTRLIKRL